ncbi:MAG TPA: type IV toxin-antitoxin system AbiEi family antitoxin domain-containing protein [Spirochaetia bacterium]|nr:type IV toxin-antitoxin system AbiEi family antitoxin domain-containing protein [Spirochaetia bacterium]
MSELEQAGIGAFFRPRDVRPLGISHYQIQRMVAEGRVERVDVGLYRVANAEVSELETIAMVASAVPHAIICLLSALRVHEIGTQSPRRVWLAIDRKARKPSRLPTAVSIVRFSGQMLSYGVVSRQIQGVSVSITSPARTIVDCFRYRNKIGLDVAMEALRDAVRSRKASVSEIDRAAEVCRVSTVMAPYLEALSV